MRKILIIMSFIYISGCSAVFWENFSKSPQEILQNADTAMNASNFDDAYELYDMVCIFCYDDFNNYSVRTHRVNECTEDALYIFTKKYTALLQSTSPDFMKIGRLDSYSNQIQSLKASKKTITAMNAYLKVANKITKNTDDSTLQRTIQETINAIKEKQKYVATKNQTPISLIEQERRKDLQEKQEQQEQKLKELNLMSDKLDKENEALKQKKMF